MISLIDISKKEIPSSITTPFMIIMVMVVGPLSIFPAIVMGLFGWFFIEMKFFEGGADLKVMVALGTLLSSSVAILLFIVILAIAGLGYKIIMKELVKKDVKEIPFIPVFFAPLIILFQGGVIG